MANPFRSKLGSDGCVASSLFESLEARRLLSAAVGHRYTVGRKITPGIQYRPATDAHPTGRHAIHKKHVAHTQFVQLLPKGQATPTGIGSTVPVGLTATQVRQAYGVNTLTFGGVVGDGAGQTIAIIDAFDHPGFVDSTAANFLSSDLHKFDVAMGLPDPPSFRKIDERGGTDYPAANAGWAGEIALDVEWAHAMAPMANIVLIVADSANTYDLIEVAADTARNLPGVTAVSMSFAVDGGFDGEDYYDQFFTTPVGHVGVTFLAATGDNGAVLPGGGTTKQAAYPSESPNVVAVGGTSLQQNNGAYVSESGWSGSGGGISNYIAKPSYQSSITLSSTQRMAPDVSILADPNTGVAVYDSYNNTNGWFGGYFGGTSLSSPLWAGLVALTNQGRALNGVGSLSGVDQTLPRLYSAPASNLHDITTGNNGYAAGPGYDLVTGRGTPIVTTLLPSLAGGTYSGYTFIDRDNSKTYDPGIDTPLPGVTVYDDLNNNSAMQASEPSVLSDASGHFTLDLSGGRTYTIRTVRPTGYALTTLAGYSSQTAYGAFDAGSFGFFPTTINLPNGQPNTVTLRLDATGNTLQFFQNTPATGTPAYVIGKTVLANFTLTFNGGDGNDTLNVDLANGNPLICAANFVFNGGTQTSADTIDVVAAASGSAATFNATTTAVGTRSVTTSGVEARGFVGQAGNDQVTVNNVSPAFVGGGGSDTIAVGSGTYAPMADLGADGTAVTLSAGASSVNLVTSQHLAALSLSGTAVQFIGTGIVVHTGTLTTSTTGGFIDVGVDALIVDNPGTSATPGSDVAGLVATGYAGGVWTGPGIRSSSAASDSAKQHAVGYGAADSILNLSGVQTGLFMSETVATGAMLVRYTVYGDADLNGAADFNDFLRMQNNFGAADTTWDRGDFNFDGTTDFNDFLSLQNTFGLLA